VIIKAAVAAAVIVVVAAMVGFGADTDTFQPTIAFRSRPLISAPNPHQAAYKFQTPKRVFISCDGFAGVHMSETVVKLNCACSDSHE
jgi:hypothetical protein